MLAMFLLATFAMLAMFLFALFALFLFAMFCYVFCCCYVCCFCLLCLVCFVMFCLLHLLCLLCFCLLYLPCFCLLCFGSHSIPPSLRLSREWGKGREGAIGRRGERGGEDEEDRGEPPIGNADKALPRPQPHTSPPRPHSLAHHSKTVGERYPRMGVVRERGRDASEGTRRRLVPADGIVAVSLWL